jgi:hypothetical protein
LAKGLDGSVWKQYHWVFRSNSPFFSSETDHVRHLSTFNII